MTAGGGILTMTMRIIHTTMVLIPGIITILITGLTLFMAGMYLQILLIQKLLPQEKLTWVVIAQISVKHLLIQKQEV